MPAPEPALKKFGSNVRARRDAKELPQEKLAELADLDRTYTSSIARDVRDITAKAITAYLRQMDAEGTCNSRGEAWTFANGESVFNCTAGARRVAQAFGGVVVGYDRDDNAAAELLCDDGHDFAVVANRFVVDYWAAYIVAAIDRAVLDLHDPFDRATVLRLYGQPDAWKPLVFRNPREIHEQESKLDTRRTYLGV